MQFVSCGPRGRSDLARLLGGKLPKERNVLVPMSATSSGFRREMVKWPSSCHPHRHIAFFCKGCCSGQCYSTSGPIGHGWFLAGATSEGVLATAGFLRVKRTAKGLELGTEVSDGAAHGESKPEALVQSTM